jgi:hypothetical protein
VPPATHSAFCTQLTDCTLIQFQSNFSTGPIYFHEMLVETDRASVIEAIQSFISDQLCGGKKYGKKKCCKKQSPRTPWRVFRTSQRRRELVTRSPDRCWHGSSGAAVVGIASGP